MALPAGSFYTEPSGVAHFAETRAEPVVVYITGDGPSDTQYVKTTAEPARHSRVLGRILRCKGERYLAASQRSSGPVVPMPRGFPFRFVLD